jgi:hypothetical protein
MHTLLCSHLQDIKRSYRSLAQVFHPDKHLEDDLRDKAQEAFSKLQVCIAEAVQQHSTYSAAAAVHCWQECAVDTVRQPSGCTLSYE